MSTEVKPTDWDAEDNRWEPTPSGGGGSGLPSYTSADKGKFLGLGDGEGSSVDIVPEQELVISGNPTDATSIDNANTEYFVNGATIHVLIKAGYATDVDEDVAVTQSGADIGTGDIYGKLNAYQFYIEGGVLKFWCNYTGTYTVHVTVFNASVTPVWENVAGAVTITLPAELDTMLMSTLQQRAPAAIAAAGMPVYNDVGSYSTASDLDALEELYTEIANAKSEGCVLRLSGGTLVTQAVVSEANKLADITFSYKMYQYSTYVFNIDLKIRIDADAEYDNYGISSVITLVS